MKLFQLLLLGYIITAFACTESTIKDKTADAKRIAGMQCMARELTHQKFLLANEYGTVDQLIVKRKITPDSATKIRQRLDRQKTLLVEQSQKKSDELLQFLRRVWKDKYKTKEDRKTLDSLTELELRQICKIASP